jgi:hypothetical protein
VSTARTRSAQIGVQSATIGTELDSQIGSNKEGVEGERAEGKIKGLSALLSFLPATAALAALTRMQNVIQTSDGKVKGTKVRFL